MKSYVIMTQMKKYLVLLKYQECCKKGARVSLIKEIRKLIPRFIWDEVSFSVIHRSNAMQDTLFSCFLPFFKGRRHDLFQIMPHVYENIDLEMGGNIMKMRESMTPKNHYFGVPHVILNDALQSFEKWERKQKLLGVKA